MLYTALTEQQRQSLEIGKKKNIRVSLFLIQIESLRNLLHQLDLLDQNLG